MHPVAPTIHAPSPLRKFIRSRFLERTARAIPRSQDVLDLCCGYGFYFSINPRARGVDGDPQAVAQLRERGYAVEWANVLEGLPFAPASFGVVVAHDVFEHFSFAQLEGLVPEIHRVLRPGGRLIVWVPNARGYELGVNNGSGHVLFVTAAEIERLIPGRFRLEKHYAEPLPRLVGQYFAHNKEVFVLQRL
ncbi:MAG: Methyltransferase protein [Candidatus Eremiobacteraeota bacterium]|nr:Methyltransferase protein [Candidatus Eremiobacteraeota bacterium]